jgi:hypothetical protein
MSACKWPLCQSEAVQQVLAEDIHRELYSGLPTHAELVAALRALVATHVEPAGLTLDIVRDSQRFEAFMADVKQRCDTAVAQAQAVLKRCEAA